VKAVSISMREREIYLQAYNKNQAGQEKNEIQLPSGPVKHYLSNRGAMFMPYQLHHLLGDVHDQ